MKTKTRYLTVAAAVAALYVVLTGMSALLGLDKGVIQFRISEALTVLPCLTPAAIPGLFVGCLLSNLLYAGALPDLIFGSLATLLGAVGTYYLGNKVKWLAALPPILSNTVIIPFVLRFAYHLEGGLHYFAATVFLGEFVCCGIAGSLLLYHFPKPILRQLK
ncbi:MAG: QueT transporter family protein [Ruminococcaceae bacterium]|nr:QueT transporter family protein [Oscillospiraceae bacterium]